MLPRHHLLVFKAHTNFFFCARCSKGKELSWCDFVKKMFNIVMFQDTCERICFKLVLMLNTTRLYSLIPV